MVVPMTISQDDEQDNMFNQIPDDILIYILKRLDIRDAFKCSVLSRRWRHIPNMLSNIVLDVASFKPNHDDGFTCTSSDEAMSNMVMVQAAKCILTRRNNIPITNLSLTFYMRKESIGIINAVEDAMSNRGCGVVAAKFIIIGEKIDLKCSARDMVRQGRLFLSYFNTCPSAFAGLTSLHIESVTLSESDIPKVLCICQKLEFLSLLNCEIGEDRALILEHAQLTELKLVSCCCDGVELKWLPKLSQITCECWFPSRHGCPLLFGHVPKLSRLMLFAAGYAHYVTLKLSHLLVNCATLDELHLDFLSYRIWVVPESPRQLAPLLQNLKVVNLENVFEECDLTWTLFLLQAAPFLNALQVKISNHECIPMNPRLRIFIHRVCKKENMKMEYCDFKHRNLVVLKIIGFQPEEKIMAYIRRVKKAAVNLELIDLLDDWCPECGVHPVTKYPRTKEERDQIKKQVNEGTETVRFYNRSLDGQPIVILE